MRWVFVYRDDELGAALRTHFAGQADVDVVSGDICNRRLNSEEINLWDP